MATKNQQELLDYLGPQYFLRNIDGEPCICRNINTRYDLEISGTAKKKTFLRCLCMGYLSRNWNNRYHCRTNN